MTDINEKINKIWDAVVSGSLDLAKNIIIAIIVFYIGKYAINFLLKVVKKVMLRRNVDETVSKFILNILKISLQVTLFIAIIGILGVKTSSIMGLIAATGFGVGMALSGTMQNFANGILLLVFHPYKVGDFIEVNDISGTVKAIQIFHTILVTTDNKVIYIPNGTMGTATMINYNQQVTRRIDWVIDIDYGEDFDRVKAVIDSIIASEPNILKEPAPVVELNELSASSVKVLLRCWVATGNYWTLYYSVNRKIYEQFNQNNINFPYPQITVHTSK
ncbi:MAG: mechanosensitive ion channel family protein [Bacteroidota bacterium]